MATRRFPTSCDFSTTRNIGKRCSRRSTNEQVRAFWRDEFAHFNPHYRQEAIGPIQNKVGAFLADPRLRVLLTGDAKDLSVRRLMDEGKILLVNLSKGELGEDSANLLGALLVRRSRLPPSAAPNYPSRTGGISSSISTSFRTSRRLRSRTWSRSCGSIASGSSLRISISTSLSRMSAMRSWERRDAHLFPLGAEDAQVIARELSPEFDPEDLLNLPNYTIVVALESFDVPSAPTEATVRGYKVKVKRQAITPGDVVAARSTVAEILLGRSRKVRGCNGQKGVILVARGWASAPE